MFIFRQCLNEDMLGPWITNGIPSTKYSACNCTDGIQVIWKNPKEREFGGKLAGCEWGSVGTWYSKSHLSLSVLVDFVLWIMTESPSLGTGKEEVTSEVLHARISALLTSMGKGLMVFLNVL